MSYKDFYNNKFLDQENINKRARAKFSQAPLIDALCNLKNSQLTKKYQETKYCSEVLEQKGKKITSRYCKNRFCKICNRNMTGKLINEYGDELEKLIDKRFITLTVPNVNGDQLRATIKKMTATVQKIQDKRRKGKKQLITGIRKLECTYNVEKNNFHPHLHFIISGKESGDDLIKDWLNYWPAANIKAQENKEATECIELFKYFTKLTSNAGKQFSNGTKLKDEWHFPEAIDVIFTAIQRLRIIQSMGNFSKIDDTINEVEAIDVDGETLEVKQHDIYIFNGVNWFSPYTGVLLSSFKPSIHLNNYRKKIRYLKKLPDK